MRHLCLALSLLVALPVLAEDPAQEQARLEAELGPLLTKRDTLRRRVGLKLSVFDRLRARQPGEQWRAVTTLTEALPAGVTLLSLELQPGVEPWPDALAATWVGTQADGDALGAKLTAAGMCKGTSVTTQSTTVTVACANEHRTPWLPSFPTGTERVVDRLEYLRQFAGQKEELVAEARALEGRAQDLTEVLPDLPKQDLAYFTERATERHVTLAVPRHQPTVTDGAVDVLPLVLVATGEFPDLAAVADVLVQNRQTVRLAHASYGNRRERNGRVLVDATFWLETYRYRVEAEPPGASASFSNASRPLPELPALKRTERDAFSTTPARYGVSKPFDAALCRSGRTDAKWATSGYSYDELQVVYATATCAMVLEADGGCHVLRRYEHLARGKITALSPTSVTVTEFVSLDDGRVAPRLYSMTAPTGAHPPPRFCTGPAKPEARLPDRPAQAPLPDDGEARRRAAEQALTRQLCDTDLFDRLTHFVEAQQQAMKARDHLSATLNFLTMRAQLLASNLAVHLDALAAIGEHPDQQNFNRLGDEAAAQCPARFPTGGLAARAVAVATTLVANASAPQ